MKYTKPGSPELNAPSSRRRDGAEQASSSKRKTRMVHRRPEKQEVKI